MRLKRSGRWPGNEARMKLFSQASLFSTRGCSQKGGPHPFVENEAGLRDKDEVRYIGWLCINHVHSWQGEICYVQSAA